MQKQTEKTLSKLKMAMIEYNANDPKRIHHLLKVHSVCKLIGEGENLTETDMFILESTSLTHDIGIKISEIKYGNSNGKNQEIEGVQPATEMLTVLGYSSDEISRITHIISHHHTYTNVEDICHQIMLEGDFLINMFEARMQKKAIQTAKETFFKTKTGLEMVEKMEGEK